MYRPHEFINAFCLAQLERLDENNAKRIEFSESLTAGLAEIPGFAGPYDPEYAQPVYYVYVVEFRPQDLDLDCTPLEMKQACVKALAAEGIGLGQWQTRPIPGQDVFLKKEGFGRGVPWSLVPDVEYDYSGEEYPRTVEFIDAHSYLRGVYPPNEMDLIELYLEGFRKIADNMDRVMELSAEA